MALVGRRVLLVEDEFLASLGAIDLLESIGCEVVGPVARVAAAVQVVQSESLDAAVLDINISGEFIWPVAEELRQKNVPFLFLSAYSKSYSIPGAFDTVSRLSKPLEPSLFLYHIGVMLGDTADEGIPTQFMGLRSA